MDHWEHYKEDLSLAFEKPIGNGNTYSKAGTAELKPYARTSKKFRTKLDYILFLWYFFRCRRENYILKTKNHPRGLSMVYQYISKIAQSMWWPCPL